MKFNIVFIGYSSGFGGAEKSMIMVANGLANMGNKVTIISLRDNDVAYKIDKCVDYIYIPDCKGSKLKKIVHRFSSVKSSLSDIKPNAVISFWLQPAMFAAILAKFMGFKSIYSERGDPSDKEYKGFLGYLRRIIFCLIDGFVFQTRGAQLCFSNNIRKKSVIINNPVYLKYDEYDMPQKRRKVIVNVGRLHEQKNQKLLIDSFKQVSTVLPEYNMEIYGEGELENNLLAQIKNLDLNDRVFLKGTSNNLYDKIVDASLFVLSSDYEGMPNALMEAMALGIPSISTDWKPGGVSEIITNGENGIIVKANSVNYLAKAILYMIENQEEANATGKRAKQICYTHSTDIIYKKWEEFVIKIIERNVQK